ncbi:MAG: DUF4469 domain-containing protein [Dysgonamonadaceae bacterium]|jgi:hypothetical protein|nr:DUF4469 domain-containing protein [Dysgonamonadaceae bacterium]
MIDYVLENNHLTKEKPNDRYARVVNVQSFTEADLAEAIARRNLGISKAEALAMLEAAAEIQLEWMALGHAINLRLIHIHPSVPGTYEDGEYPHEAIYRITPSKELVEVAKHIKLRHVEAVSPIHVESVHDLKSGTANDKITSGGTLKITGHNIKVEGALPEVCAQFISLEDPEADYRIPMSDFIVNNPSELILTAPQMVTDEEVQLKITTQYSGTKPLKTPHSITFSKVFTVI